MCTTLREINVFLGLSTLPLKPDTQPAIHAPNKHPTHQDQTRLDEEALCYWKGQPQSNWALYLAYVCTSNRKLWVSLGSKDLNEAIKHDHHTTHFIKEIMLTFAGGTFFKLDATSGYWYFALDMHSTPSLSLNMPFGRYQLLWLLLRWECMQDVFQCRMDQVLEKCKGALSIADEVCIHGTDEAEYDWYLDQIMDVTHKHDLIFNPIKCSVEVKQIKIFKSIYNAKKVHPDLDQVTSTHHLPCQHASLSYRNS